MMSHVLVECLIHVLADGLKLKRRPVVYTTKKEWFESFPTEEEIFVKTESTGGAIYGTAIVNRNAILINLASCYKDEIGEQAIISTILEEVLHMKYPKMSEPIMAKLIEKYNLKFR